MKALRTIRHRMLRFIAILLKTVSFVNMSFEIYRLDVNVTFEYRREIYVDSVHRPSRIRLTVCHQVSRIFLLFFNYLSSSYENILVLFYAGWREFAKTSRPSICDLRFEEILSKIRPEKLSNERGAMGTASSPSYYTNNGSVDGNGRYSLSKSSICIYVHLFKQWKT